MSITTRQFLKAFNYIVDDQGGPTEAADYFGVSSSFVRSVSKGHRLPGDKVLRRMGLKAVKTIHYRYEGEVKA